MPVSAWQTNDALHMAGRYLLATDGIIAPSHSCGCGLHRRRQLLELGFEFDEEAAEWRRWYNELAALQGAGGDCSPVPLADGDTFLLFNWCDCRNLRSQHPLAVHPILIYGGFSANALARLT